MAECSYAYCVQERRAIKKELQRWTKNMVFVVGLERIAEELMGRRKWKQYQEDVLVSPSTLEAEAEVPSDWEPTDKCRFCDGAALPDLAVNPSLSDSESSSNSQSSFRETPPAILPESHHNHHFPTANHSPSNAMTTLESVTSMAASLAAVAALSSNQNHSISVTSPSATTAGTMPFYPTPHHTGLFPPWYLAPSPPHPLANMARTIPPSVTALTDGLKMETAPSIKQEVSASPMVMTIPQTVAEQPLDLSAKATDSGTIAPCQQSLRVPNIDNKHILKAKPRMSAISGRRTYTEDELQAALRDIQSGKLGTRRAAVIYGIPRSTLRNKVYKLAMERERDSHLVAAEALKVEEDEKELSAAEEEQEVEKVLRKPLLSMEDLIRFSVLDSSGSTSDSLRALLRLHEERSGSTSPSECLPFPLDMWGGLEHSTLAPYISNLLAAAGLSNRVSHRESIPANFAKFPNHLPEIMRRMVTEEKILFDEHLRKNISIGPSIHLNGSHSEDEENRKNRPEVIVHPKATSREDDESMDVDTAGTAASGTATPPNVILRIPSFKPTSKNGVVSGSSGGIEPLLLNQNIHKSDVASPGLVQVSSQPICFETHSNSDSCSPPVNSSVGKGVGVSLRDVIAKSISQKFQQHSVETMLPLSHPQHKILYSSNEIDNPTNTHRQFTPPLSNTPSSIAASVIKNNNNNIHEDHNVQKLSPINKSPSSSSSTGCTSTGGKGTRPKRGKYRNYDRDSLVEAVRAVQRGEMSVHRAGSYYGVPHSTLEYKVKERHLMRPRKREPKTHIDDTKRKDECLRMSSPDKPKLSQKPFKPLYGPSSPLSNPPNGLKMPPLFDPNMPLPYPPAPPFPFWPTNPFHSLPLSDFPRGTGGPPGFSSTHEQFYASQMMQRLQEDSSRSHPSISPGVSCSPPIIGPGSTLGKSAREMAESLYDGTGANGSFLDGIIRSSLEMGLHAGHPKSCGDKNEVAEKMSNKTLLDQLCKNSRFPPLSHPSRDGSSSDEDSSVKRLSESTFRKTDSEASMSANLDFSPSSNGSVTRDEKHPDDMVEDDDSKPIKPLSPVDNTNKSFISDDHDLKLSPKERISVGSDELCDPTDEESACDSKQSLLKVDANNAAKDGVVQERTEEEETESKMINSPRD